MIDRKSAKHYSWGQGCDGWHLLSTSGLSVIEEQMPSQTSETRHHHQVAHQFFYVLSGVLSFEIDGVEHDLEARKGIEIAPGVPHRVFNRSPTKVEFLVISNPPSHGDRIADDI